MTAASPKGVPRSDSPTRNPEDPCPNGQTISFSLVHPVIDENYVSKIRKRFGMPTSTFNRLYDETTGELHRPAGGAPLSE